MPRRKSTPVKKRSKTAYRGFKQKNYSRKAIIPGLNYVRQRCVLYEEIVMAAGTNGLNMTIPWQ